MNRTTEIAERAADDAEATARWRRRANRMFVGFIVLVAAMTGVVGFVVQRELAATSRATEAVEVSQREAERAREAIHQAQRDACARLNEVRHILRDQIRAETEQQERLIESGAYERFFPNIPPGELDALLREGRKRDRETRNRLHPIDCKAVYPDP